MDYIFNFLQYLYFLCLRILKTVCQEYEEKHYFECIVYNDKNCFSIGLSHTLFSRMTTKRLFFYLFQHI